MFYIDKTVIKKSCLSVLMLALLLGSVQVGYVHAQGGPPRATCNDGTSVNVPSAATTAAEINELCADHGGYTSPVIEGEGAETTDSIKTVKSDCQGDTLQAGAPEDSPNHCAILDYLQIFIRTLSALVGIVVVLSIIVAGIQYSSSADDPQKVGAAKDRVRNALIALGTYIFMIAFLNWVVPGGVF